MKVNHLLESEEVQTVQFITDSSLDNQRYKRGILNVVKDVIIVGERLEHLPFKFGKVDGDFICHTNHLDSFNNAPYYIGDVCSYHTNNLSSFEDAPRHIGGLFAIGKNPRLTSFVGINKHIDYIGGVIHFDQSITSGGLGLLLIKGIKFLDVSIPTSKTTSNQKEFTKIINKYLADGTSNIKGMKALYMCEDELLQAGLEAYAQI